MDSTLMLQVCGSISTKCGVAPAWIIASTVAANVLATVMTMSSLPTLAAISANLKASVPLLTPTQCAALENLANSCSNCSTSGPPTNIPVVSTPFTASMSSSCNSTCGATKSTNGIPFPGVILQFSFRGVIPALTGSLQQLLKRGCSRLEFGKATKIVISHFRKVSSGRNFQTVFPALFGSRCWAVNAAYLYSNGLCPCAVDRELNDTIHRRRCNATTINEDFEVCRIRFSF